MVGYMERVVSLGGLSSEGRGFPVECGGTILLKTDLR